MEHSDENSSEYKKNSLTLTGAVAMGTGVMIGAGIFALTGQVAELAKQWFPLAFLVAAIVASFSAYSYVKMAHAYPSAGGIAMFLEKAYGKTALTGAFALLMYFSMIINESLVAKTFGTYTLQLFNVGENEWLVVALGVGLHLSKLAGLLSLQSGDCGLPVFHSKIVRLIKPVRDRESFWELWRSQFWPTKDLLLLQIAVANLKILIKM